MVQNIEEFRPELQFPALGDWNILLRRKIDVDRPWPAQDVAAGVSESARSIRAKRGGGKPLLDFLSGRAAGIRGRRDQVGCVVSNPSKGIVVPRTDGQRKTALPVPDARGLPVPEQLAQSFRLGCRQLPDVIQDEPPSHIVIGKPTVGCHIVGVDDADSIQVSGERLPVDTLGEGVIHSERKALGEPLIERQLEGVIDRVGAGNILGDALEILQRPPRLRRGRCGAGSVNRSVQVGVVTEVRPLRCDIGSAQENVFAKLVLEREIPAKHSRRLPVGRERDAQHR